LRRLAQDLRRRRRRRFFFRTAGAAAAAVACAGTVGLWLRLSGGDQSATPLNCSQVLALADAFVAGQLDGLQSEQVRNHLAKCPACAAWFQSRGR
jgi:predicted anti-sigma-YlaC factor YlaD